MMRTAVVPMIAACGVVLNAYSARGVEPAGPTILGTFGAWTAGMYRRGQEDACYAFTLTTKSSRRPGKHRVGMITVSKRKGRAAGVVLSPGVPYPKAASTSLHVGRRGFAFSTAHNSAFAQDSPAVIEALAHGLTARTRRPGPTHHLERFDLRGFTQAYDAVTTACP